MCQSVGILILVLPETMILLMYTYMQFYETKHKLSVDTANYHTITKVQVPENSLIYYIMNFIIKCKNKCKTFIPK